MTFTRRWLALFLIGAVPIALSGTAFGSVMEITAAFWYLALLALTIMDRATTASPELVTVQRSVGDRLALGVESTISLQVRNASSRKVRLWLTDSCPAELTTDGRQSGTTLPLEVEPRSRSAATYSITPSQRGDHTFGGIYLRVRGRMGFIEKLRRCESQAAVKVYPNLANTEQFNLMARRGRLQQLGIRKTRFQGMGRDFESLRDYMPDDEMRRIDWKATARRGKFVSRQYEIERSQAVIIALDVGRTMLTELEGVQKLDYAINAALLLAYVATMADDMVGLIVFSDTVHSYLPPRRGRTQVYAILEHLYNVRASLAEADYKTAFAYLQSRWRKRALIVCFTDLWDPDSSRQTMEELGMLQPRHLVAAVTLLDTRVRQEASQEVADVADVYRKAVAIQVMDERARAQEALTQRGVLVVDSPAESISVALVNRYLEVKSRMLL